MTDRREGHRSSTRRTWIALALGLGLPAILAGSVWPGLAVTPARPDAAGWSTVGLNPAETRDSPLVQIDAGNVGRLAPAWFADLTPISQRAFEATPIVVDGRMFVSTAWSVVVAFDAKTGAELWRYDPQVAKDYAGKGCCGPVSRGVAYAAGRIFLAAFDGRLIALDATSGKPIWSTLTVDQSKDYTITGAPRVIGDNVVIGNGGAELGVRGYVSAYDMRTGRQAWRFYTVPPKPGTRDGAASDAILAKAAGSWSGDWWKLGGGGTVWDAMAYDPKLDLLYIGVGNGGPWNRKMRSDGKGDNLFISSIVALRPRTGEYVWHFQTTPGDQWDYTASQSIILTDLVIGGRTRQVLMQAPKNGFYYVIDRATGEFLSGDKYVPVTWATGLDPKTGRPIEAKTVRYSETGIPSEQQPGPLGGHNWHPMSFGSGTGYAYIPAIVTSFNYVPAGPDYMYHQGAPNMGIDPVATAVPGDPKVLEAARAAIHGELIAWDPVRRRAAWRVRHDVAWNGGTLSTASGLVFQGDAAGDFAAYDGATGRRLWSLNLGAGIVAAPMTYAIGTDQYVAIAVGWGGGLTQVAGALAARANSSGINRLVVLKLDGTAALPPVKKARQTIDPPAAFGTPAMIAAGRAIFERRCYACHGGAVISGGEVPDLRHSAIVGDAATFREVLRDGLLAANGMPSFRRDLTDADAESIRAYIAARAIEDAKAEADAAGKTTGVR